MPFYLPTQDTKKLFTSCQESVDVCFRLVHKIGMVHLLCEKGERHLQFAHDRPSPPTPLPMLGEGSRYPFFEKFCVENRFSPSPEVGMPEAGQAERFYSCTTQPSSSAASAHYSSGTADTCAPNCR